jgi:hypothetical protein
MALYCLPVVMEFFQLVRIVSHVNLAGCQKADLKIRLAQLIDVFGTLIGLVRRYQDLEKPTPAVLYLILKVTVQTESLPLNG